MYSSNTTCNSGLIQWYADDSYASEVMGVSNGFLVPPSPCFGQAAGWHTYSVDLRALGIQLGGRPWSGAIRELLLHPFAGNGAASATVKLDWARLTAADPTSARPYTVQWTGNGSGGAVTLWASPGNRTLDPDDILIAQGQSAAGGSYVYQTGVLPAGDYYVAATNSSGTVWSAGPLTISRPPAVRITKPSPTSGPEFSAGVLGRPWDMNEPGDLNDDVPPMINTCVSNPRTIGGIYAAEVPPGCPGARPMPTRSCFWVG